MSEKKKTKSESKKVQVTLDAGIYEIVQEMKEKVYKTDSDSKVCASIIEAYLNEHDYLRKKLEEKTTAPLGKEKG